MNQDRAVDALRESFSGELILPHDQGYEQARGVFNAMIDKRPAVVARCASTADVAACVRAAGGTGLQLAVRSGGHSVSGLGVCEGGILIDLAGIKNVEVDPAARTARAGGGVLWGEFDAATQVHGLHTPGGRVTTTGVGGFTTGGGYGWTSSKYGLTCDNLVSATVVLADGSTVTASERENGDLFWGIRGGGGNFGVVTEFELGLHPLGPIVLAGLALWPIDSAQDVIRGWRDYVDDAPDELSTACVIITAPPEEFVPESLKGRPAVGMAVLYVGDPDQGRGRRRTAPGIEARCGPDSADALHRFPGLARPDGTTGLPQLLARRVPEHALRRRDRRIRPACSRAHGSGGSLQPDDPLPDRPGGDCGP